MKKNYTAKLERDRRKEEKKAVDIAREQAFIMMIAIPINILAIDYWEKSAKKRIPEFVDKIAGLYEAVQQGVVTYEQMVEDIKRLSGMEITADWLKRSDTR